MPEFDDLIEEGIPESNVASERCTSSLIDNFDQSEYIKNVIMQSRKIGGSRFGSPGQNILNLRSQKLKALNKEDKSFMKDMKKYGILKAFNDINKFTEFFGNTPKGEICLDYNGTNNNHCSSQILDNSYHNSSMQQDLQEAEERNTKSTVKFEDMLKEEHKGVKSFK
jgi:hypothetical protein